MITASITVSPSARQIAVEVLGPLENRKGLNAVLAQRLAVEIKEHFRVKNGQPNNRGWRKTGFWNQLSRATAVDKDSITDTGADVVVADARLAIHLYGGQIKPTGGREFLTIPLIQEANGLRVDSYEKKFKRELFRLPDTRVLVEKRMRGGDRSMINATTGSRFRNGVSSTVEVGARQQLRAVYALAPSVRIPADPDALPSKEKIQAALADEADKFIARELAKGGTK